MFDIIIRNGTVVDGTGKESFAADVAVSKNKIAKIGKINWSKGRVEIDAKGKIVAPGFIDIHNHSDGYWQIFLDPQLPSLVYQGITTIIGGNCGASIAPLADIKIIESIQKWTDLKKVNVDWLTMSEFSEKMKMKNLSLNFGTLIGHGTLRRGIIHDEMRRLDRNEFENIKRILENSLSEGALGFSAGLAYSHEKKATWDELAEFSGLVKSSGRVFSVHLRDEASGIIVALQEAIDLAKQTGVNLEISHLKVMGEQNWPLVDKVLEIIKHAEESGVDVNFDVYPYTQTGSVLYVYLPDWAADGGRKMLIRRLKDSHSRRKIIEEMKETAQYHYEDAVIAACSFSKSLTKRKISEIAAERGLSVEEAIVDLLVASEGRVITLMECLSEENLKKLISHPLSIIATDGAGYSVSDKESGELVHPRCFGAFPRVLGKYVREEKILSLEEAVKKMTGLPAKKFKLEGRGVLEKGNFADITVFDPKIISDKATVENPYQYSEGVEQVVVNGKFAMRDRKLTGEMSGEFISN
ncbi:MAG: D-aminoacylase [Candidatus Moranbacteria bacterium]|nr:D-aminoacylase [Candidatus Moranbacteria bacterium]